MLPSIEVRVRLFAGAAQAVAKTELVLLMDLDEPDSNSVTIKQIAEKLQRDFPQLSSWIARSRWAVGDQFSTLTARVSANQSVAMIPPVSGG